MLTGVLLSLCLSLEVRSQENRIQSKTGLHGKDFGNTTQKFIFGWFPIELKKLFLKNYFSIIFQKLFFDYFSKIIFRLFFDYFSKIIFQVFLENYFPIIFQALSFNYFERLLYEKSSWIFFKNYFSIILKNYFSIIFQLFYVILGKNPKNKIISPREKLNSWK